ncbi:branched-chain amino acid ABC transporter permease [Pusillimonas sp. T2]|uniref:branched-chain amino acid ABC transporter permease n=1 Tax=Pusillimonas sp. T2 TaxID=1548123 RepID=UPI000B8B73FE|nr:branched-chain amino acid ABC transporter permease [Pusillimonas sp. T2]OXR48067.1 branched-chain amino acid ABC transporter permease [Pusillimonas sp. T2]
MSMSLFVAQLLNSVQLGALLFLMSAGLTLIFGIMNFLNLAHGSIFMVGAYVGATVAAKTGSFTVAIIAAVAATMILGVIVERTLLRQLYLRDHLDQVLCTFGLLLIANEVVRYIWGASPVFINVPDMLSGTVSIFGQSYPAYRFAIILAGLLVVLGLYLLISRTRLGMLIRAGANNASMVSALGVNIKFLNTVVFALGAGLAGLGGLLVAPLVSVQPGMGEPILILTLVVIVIGGVGSIRGAFYGALIVGLIDTAGRIYLQIGLLQIFERSVGQAVGPAIASMLIYILMAIVLAFKPQGLFPVKHG